MAKKPERFEMRFDVNMIERIDDWRRKQPDLPSRTAAIRHLIEVGLAVAQPQQKTSKKAASKASEMAGQEIDRLSNESLPAEERERRKRRLTKGPSEFRDMRGDVPKPKG
jgi:hypothetical protein